jgi:hypothetical protein
MMRRRHAVVALLSHPGTPLLVVALAAAAPAAALDRFEIQVYGPDLNAPGEVGVELHLNYAFRGDRVPAFPGEIPPDRSVHYTIEPAVGVTGWLELGGYLQALSAPGSGLRYGGFKLRAKMVVPRRHTGDFFLGLNVEVGRVPAYVEEEGWANEFRPILGWTDGVLLVDVNPIFGYALTGPDAFRVVLEPAAKVSANTQLGFALGIEWYTALGFADAILPGQEQQHLLLATFDLAAPKGGTESWELGVGVGAGLTGATDRRWLAKAIVGRAF